MYTWAFYENLGSILSEGLKVGANRKHIHFAPLADESDVGIHIRPNAEVAIWLDLQRAIASGIPFYRAKNQVIVTAGRLWACLLVPHRQHPQRRSV